MRDMPNLVAVILGVCLPYDDETVAAIAADREPMFAEWLA